MEPLKLSKNLIKKEVDSILKAFSELAQEPLTNNPKLLYSKDDDGDTLLYLAIC